MKINEITSQTQVLFVSNKKVNILINLCAVMRNRSQHLTATIELTLKKSTTVLALIDYKVTANFISHKILEEHLLISKQLHALVI